MNPLAVLDYEVLRRHTDMLERAFEQHGFVRAAILGDYSKWRRRVARACVRVVGLTLPTRVSALIPRLAEWVAERAVVVPSGCITTVTRRPWRVVYTPLETAS
jgi:hypothetical protein